MRTLTALLALVLTATTFADEHASASERDRAALVANVGEIAAPGVPGPLLVTSETAFPVIDAAVSKGVRAPVVAAGTMGDGRFIAFGHTGYVSDGVADVADTWPLLVAAVSWTAPRAVREARIGSGIRIGATDAALVERFRRGHFNCVHLKGRRWTAQLATLDVLVCGSHALGEEEIDAVRWFVESGKGLVVGGLAWGWLQLNPGRTLDAHPGNRLLGPAGVFWADGYLKRTTEAGYAVEAALSPMLHARKALQSLDVGTLDDADRAQAAWTATQAVRMLPEDDRTLRPLIDDLVEQHGGAIVPSKREPLRATQALERLLLTVDLERAAKAPVDTVAAHPAAEVFPGAVPEALPVERVIEIDPGRPGWHGTGVYARPGGVITVTVPAETAQAGWRVRLGCHKDTLYHKERWDRAPDITRVEPIVSETTRIAGAFGGLVYIDVPPGAAGRTSSITITGGVAAPRFVFGATSVDAWRDEIRNAPGPWAELETSKVIITVPSSEIRTLEDPEALMRFWDQVLDAAATLAVRPLERDRPERYVADVQISAGYMHAGYPIMTHLDAASRMVDVESLRRGAWGLYHELGHNHQSRDWTFSGTGEVTCNLFSLYITDTLCHVPPGERGHTGATGDVGQAAYLAEPDFEHWKRKPFLALRMYIQLQDAFGWEPFKRVFATYRDLPAPERPGNDAEKRDQWMVRLSREIGRDLGPFFERWGVPTSAAAREAIEHLPGWMPGELTENGERM